MAQGFEQRWALDPPDQADSFWRPFKRRALMMARPARVDMR
jgi:hypothetical protein